MFHRSFRRPALIVCVRILVSLAVACSALWPAGAAGGAADDPWPYVWPIDAAVTDPFRPPATRYGPGNRGLEFATDPGMEVRAARAGTVTFSGQVGAALHVTVRHSDGVRTSYSYLLAAAVSRGDSVATGQPIATTGVRLHVGARIGKAYIDPAILFGASRRVHLVPVPSGNALALSPW